MFWLFRKPYGYKNLVQSLKETISKKAKAEVSRIAVLVVDVQKEFSSPDRDGTPETERIAAKIQSVIPHFRKAAVPVYAIYYSDDKKADPEFNHFQPRFGDTLIRKTSSSSFDKCYPNLKKLLKHKKIETVLICGFNKNACVKDTALDASINFNTFVMEDLTGNDLYNSEKWQETASVEKMLRFGINFINSKMLLKDMSAKRGIKNAL